MGAKSGIEWTDASWNPVTGCTKVSQGCKNCYAEVWANMHRGEFAKDHARKFTDIRCHPEKLEIPLHWKKPRRIFVNSMSDLFHEQVPDEFIDKVFGIMMRMPRHTFQILTKRADRMYRYLFDSPSWRSSPAPNIWLGVSCEDQATAKDRIPLLAATPAAIRWISGEPLLGAIHIPLIIDPEFTHLIHWVVVGGESGAHARPMNLDWVRTIRDDCQANGIPFFFKQMRRSNMTISMPELDGQVWNEYPHVSNTELTGR